MAAPATDHSGMDEDLFGDLNSELAAPSFQSDNDNDLDSLFDDDEGGARKLVKVEQTADEYEAELVKKQAVECAACGAKSSQAGHRHEA